MKSQKKNQQSNKAHEQNPWPRRNQAQASRHPHPGESQQRVTTPVKCCQPRKLTQALASWGFIGSQSRRHVAPMWMITAIQMPAKAVIHHESHCACCCFSRAWLCATLWTLACQAPLSMGFSRQEYWSGLPCPPPVTLPDPGIKPRSLISLALAVRFFTTRHHLESPQ